MYASFKARTERFEGGSFIMMDATKYSVGYYPPPVEPGHVYEWPQKDHIEQAPAWCSVDLRDGNQSLIARSCWTASSPTARIAAPCAAAGGEAWKF